ncbi:hypothetical protein SKAU_G00242080 [Synaphobranchus kaupii]|uniref:Uncharacterized protein n=1 Tax=Synaphobranchus kaupii TaxID=118154 RepID=A0A9Q1F7M8_SYNKA|nr:hypothetical protein SKAU_G00242080 [Synaphobranchus kaupii]
MAQPSGRKCDFSLAAAVILQLCGAVMAHRGAVMAADVTALDASVWRSARSFVMATGALGIGAEGRLSEQSAVGARPADGRAL